MPLVDGGAADGGEEGNSGIRAVADADRLTFEAESFTAGLGTNKLFEAGGKLRVEYSSMTSPRELLEYDVNRRSYTTLKVCGTRLPKASLPFHHPCLEGSGTAALWL